MTLDLAEAFGFSDADLEHNRAGALSPAQLAADGRMRRSRVSRGSTAFLLATASAGLAVPVVRGGLDDNTGFLAGSVAAAAATLFAVRPAERPEVEVLVAEGRAQFIESEDDDDRGEGSVGTSTALTLVIGGEAFDLEPAQVDAFAAGHLYRVFHQRSPELILSVEYMSPPPD